MEKLTTVTVPLEYPIEEVSGTRLSQPITSFTFRRMKAKDTMAAEDETNKARAGYKLYAALAGVSIETFEEIDNADFETVVEKVAPLMGKSAAAAVAAAKAKVHAGAT